MRHSMVESNDSVYAQHLLVNGCGGAFAHPTHVFGGFKESHGVFYECGASYPDKQTSWKCELNHIFEVDSKLGFLRTCFRTLWNAFIDMLEHSYVSLGAVMLLLLVAYKFAPSKVSRTKRLATAILHVSAHLVAALILMLALELGLELFIRHKLSATTSGYEHSLHDHQQYVESPEICHFPPPNGTRAAIEMLWFRHLYHGCAEIIINLMSPIFDVPKFMAVTRNNICKNGMASISRLETVSYNVSVFLYFWPLTTFVISYVIGFYLCICVSMFDLHYDEAFSALRISDYKGFTRFHIKADGDLEVFTLAVDKVPQAWTEDPDWQQEKKIDPKRSSHKRWFPSKWMADYQYEDPLESVKIIDQFVIGRENRPAASTSKIEEPTS